jgi:hypothetical protein
LNRRRFTGENGLSHFYHNFFTPELSYIRIVFTSELSYIQTFFTSELSYIRTFLTPEPFTSTFLPAYVKADYMPIMGNKYNIFRPTQNMQAAEGVLEQIKIRFL